MATLLLSQTISKKYKEVSENINEVASPSKKDVRKKSMKAIMQESFFHGASWIGASNFVA